MLIREKLQEKYSNKRIDFFRTPIIEGWKESEKIKLLANGSSGNTDETDDSAENKTKVPSVDFDVTPFHDLFKFERVKVFGNCTLI